MLSLGHQPSASPARNGNGKRAAGGCPVIDVDEAMPSEGGPSDGGPRKKRIKTTKVDHTYRDFSRLSLDEVGKILGRDRDVDEASSELPCVVARAKSKNNTSFPGKLYEIVTNPDYQHIIRFMPHGRSWAVLNKEALVAEVLPKYFNHSRFESFNRQVNGWGFKRLMKRGPDHKSYYHECFLRGRPELTTLMVRLVNPGKRTPNRDAEPDFYEISAKNPLPEISSAPAAAIGPYTHSNAGAIDRFAAERDKVMSEAGGSLLPSSGESSNPVLSTVMSAPTTLLVSQVVAPPEALSNPTEQAFRLYQQLANASGQHPHPSSVMATHLNPIQAQAGIQFPPQVLSGNPSLIVPSSLVVDNAASLVPNGMGSAPLPPQANEPVLDLNSSDWVEKALPSAVPSMKRSPSFLSDDDSLRAYNVEPDPLSEDEPLKTLAASPSESGEMSSLKGVNDPLLELFAKIYFSSMGYHSDSEAF